MKRKLFFLAALLLATVMNLHADTANIDLTSGYFMSDRSSVTYNLDANISIVITCPEDNISNGGYKGTSFDAYSGVSSLAIKAAEGCTITAATLTFYSSMYTPGYVGVGFLPGSSTSGISNSDKYSYYSGSASEVVWKFTEMELACTLSNASVTYTKPAGPDMHDFLHFVGLNGNDTVRLNKCATTDVYPSCLTATFEYSTDRKNWTEYTWGTYGDPVAKTALGAAIAINAGDTVFFRAKGKEGLNDSVSVSNFAYFNFAFGTDDSIAAGGNAMSLYDATCEQDKMTDYGFYKLFNGAKQLVSAPKLPATELVLNCYGYMFQGCNSLTTAPALPASTLKSSCYSYMFSKCTSLTQAPELKATTLESKCYAYMFQGCSSLQVDTCDGSCDGAELVVPSTGASSWNQNMFKDCKGDAKYTAKTGIQLGGRYCIKEYVDRNDYLHFVGLNGNDTVRLNKFATSDYFLTELTATFEFSKDRKTWTEYKWSASADPANTYQGNPIALNQGDTVFFRAKGTKGKNATMSYGNLSYFNFAFGADDQIAAGGNIMSLYDALCGQTTMTQNGFYYLFQNAKQLVSAPKLPATTLAESCYVWMFRGCTSLTTAPALPATTLAYGCYASMFNGCTALTQIPELKATTLDGDCYMDMFGGCSSLEVDTCTGSCDGVKFEPTTTGDEPSGWNNNMFNDCKGDAKYTGVGKLIQLGGHYCIKEYKEPGPETDVENVDDNAKDGLQSNIQSQKCIENGQLIILHNGIRYSTQGQIIK